MFLQGKAPNPKTPKHNQPNTIIVPNGVFKGKVVATRSVQSSPKYAGNDISLALGTSAFAMFRVHFPIRLSSVDLYQVFYAY